MIPPRKWLIALSLLASGSFTLMWLARDPVPPSPEFPASSTFSALATSGKSVFHSPAELSTLLQSLTPQDAVSWIREYLRSGQDHPTGLDFEIGPDGKITACPTFRTFLLDALLALDPAAAAEVSREILATPTTADEWAICLRNIARADTTATEDFLRTKTEQLIRHPAWMESPSIGYLNSFDLLVHTRATTSAPLLSELIQKKDRKDIAHAGFLTFDRLVQRNPVAMLSALSEDAALQESRPEMTAQQFARADLRDPAQQAIVRTWLLDPARTATQLRSFASVYPNHNRFVSHNLLTTELPVEGTDLATHDREAAAIIATWKSEPDFQPLLPHLETISQRLAGFTRSPASSN